MIRSDEELEAALEQVTKWLDSPPRAGSAEEECFHYLLGDIENYRPTLEAPPKAPVEPPERVALRRRAQELSEHLAAHHPSLMSVVGGAVRASMGRQP